MCQPPHASPQSPSVHFRQKREARSFQIVLLIELNQGFQERQTITIPGTNILRFRRHLLSDLFLHPHPTPSSLVSESSQLQCSDWHPLTICSFINNVNGSTQRATLPLAFSSSCGGGGGVQVAETAGAYDASIAESSPLFSSYLIGRRLTSFTKTPNLKLVRTCKQA